MADLVWNLIYIILGFECSRKKVPDAGRPSGRERREVPEFPGGSRNKTRLAKVVVVANSKKKVASTLVALNTHLKILVLLIRLCEPKTHQGSQLDHPDLPCLLPNTP